MTEIVGTQIGNIRIVDTLGRGGMGEVYVGYDVKLDRKVAVKTIRKDRRLDEEAKARFLQEARVLSRLEHPHICRIHDYVDGEDMDLLVLELIDGVNLGRAIKDGLKKTTALRVAEQLAGVLAAAHSANIVHRDLKPENVMITSDGNVKVLDFGISRSLDDEIVETSVLGIHVGPEPVKASPGDPDSTHVMASGSGGGRFSTHDADDSGLRTKPGSILGTLAYMSPEQARGEYVTAASDMYSFGLLLQEMLTGRPPVDVTLEQKHVLRQVAWGQSETPEKLGADLTALIARLKSLAPGARPTASETADRLRRIRDKPRRWARRLAAVGIVVTMILAILKYSIDVTSERNAAIAARTAEAEARQQAVQIADFLIDLFELSDPGEARGNAVTARELLDRGAERVSTELEDQPEMRAKLMRTIGTVYRKLGLFEQAAPLLEEGLTLLDEQGSGDTAEVAAACSQLGSLYQELGRYTQAEAEYRRAMAIFESLGPEERQNLARVQNNLGVVCQRQGRFEEAEELLQGALRMKELELGNDDPSLAANLNNLANLYKRLHRLREAEVYYERALLIREKNLPPDHPDLAKVLSNLAYVYGEQGQIDRAEKLYLRALSINEKVFPESHPMIARNLNNLASLYLSNDRFAEAQPMLERAIPILEKSRGPQHLEVAVALYNLGEVLRKQGQIDEAMDRLERSLAIFEATQGPESTLTAYPLLGLANCQRARGNNRQAEALYARTLSIREEQLDPDDDDLRETVRDYASFLRGSGRADEAKQLENGFREPRSERVE